MPKTRSKRKSRSPEKPYSRKPKPFIHPCRTSYVKSYQDGNEFPVYNCILEGMNIDIHPLWERIRSSLEQVKKDLPVYLINGHSSVDLTLHIKKPNLNVLKEKIKSEKGLTMRKLNKRIDDYELEFRIGKLLQEGCSVHTVKKDLRPIELKEVDGQPISEDSWQPFLKMPKNTYYVGLAPIGLDTLCGDRVLLKTIKAMTGKSGVNTLKNRLFSENFYQTFQHPKTSRNIAWIPPGCEYSNRSYQFHETIGGWVQERFGVYNLQTIKTPIEIPRGERFTVREKEEQIKTLHPESELKEYLTKQISLNDSSISLKKIIEKLGPGIYIDIGCSPLYLRPTFNPSIRTKIIDDDFDEYDDHAVDKLDVVENTKELYEVAYQSIDQLRNKGFLTWKNVVTDGSFYGERSIIRSIISQPSKVVAPLSVSTDYAKFQTEMVPPYEINETLAAYMETSKSKSKTRSKSKSKKMSPQETHDEYISRIARETRVARGTVKKTKKKRRKQRKKTRRAKN